MDLICVALGIALAFVVVPSWQARLARRRQVRSAGLLIDVGSAAIVGAVVALGIGSLTVAAACASVGAASVAIGETVRQRGRMS